jgi:NADH dehydrogenase
MRARLEAFIEWAWDYFGGAHADSLLDRLDETKIEWDDGEEKDGSHTDS